LKNVACDSSQSTVNENLKKTKLLLGWLHRQKNIPLDSLSLESIVPLLKTKPNVQNSKILTVYLTEAYLDAKKKLEEQTRKRRGGNYFLSKAFWMITLSHDDKT